MVKKERKPSLTWFATLVVHGCGRGNRKVSVCKFGRAFNLTCPPVGEDKGEEKDVGAKYELSGDLVLCLVGGGDGVVGAVSHSVPGKLREAKSI